MHRPRSRIVALLVVAIGAAAIPAAGQEGKGAHAFEVTRDKKVVWTFADHDLVKSLTTVRVLDDR